MRPPASGSFPATEYSTSTPRDRLRSARIPVPDRSVLFRARRRRPARHPRLDRLRHAHHSGRRLARPSNLRQRGRGRGRRLRRVFRRPRRVLAHGPHRRVVPARLGARPRPGPAFSGTALRIQSGAARPGRRCGPAIQIQRLARWSNRGALGRRLACMSPRPVALGAHRGHLGLGCIRRGDRGASSTGPGSPSSSHTAVMQPCWPTSEVTWAASRPGQAISRPSSRRLDALSGGPTWLVAAGLAAASAIVFIGSDGPDRIRIAPPVFMCGLILAALPVAPGLVWWVPLVCLPYVLGSAEIVNSRPVMFLYCGLFGPLAADSVLPSVCAALAASARV